MIARLRSALIRDDGVTVLELSIAMLVLALLGGVLVTWAIAVTRHDQAQAEETAALDEMRHARANLVREVRYADAFDADAFTPHQIEIDVDGSTITWTIGSDGYLRRSVDAGPGEIRARDLAYDTAAGADSTRFSHDASNGTVTIELVADVAAGNGISPRTIVTQVQLRNL